MIRCTLVDDEPLALTLLEDYIHQLPFLKLAGKYGNAEDALAALAGEPVDLVFLDIHLPRMNGIQLSRTLHKDTMVVFTTAYEHYALEGFNVNALDYLLKPILFERFSLAAGKALAQYQVQQQLRSQPVVSKAPTSGFVFVKSEYRMVKVNFQDIAYIEGLKDYLKIYAGEKPILTLQSFKALEEKLPPTDFIRVHKSFLVNVHKIDAVQKNRILIGNKEIPIGDVYNEAFYRFIAAYNA
jgi:DNA-binding LytR/AlgR family response regulator